MVHLKMNCRYGGRSEVDRPILHHRPVIHSILKTVERENRGFGGHPAPEFGSTGENLFLGMVPLV